MANFYVATAIPYVNARPHLGHALLFTYGDVLARYHRLKGEEVVFSIGTDEHGGKIYDQALKLNIDVQAFVDANSEHFRKMAQKLDITHSHFIRTTDKSHKQVVRFAWQSLSKYIYKGVYEGWYCQGCEAYKTETLVKETNYECPDHKQAYKKLKEDNYFFKLSAFEDQIKQAIASDQIKIIPQAAKNEALSFLEAGLEDISISRPTANLKWGISLEDDKDQTIYVWFDALLNYITVLGYPQGDLLKSHWPADVQIIGRDILRFHAIIWPAMLMALGLPTYKTLYVHGLVTVEGQKMSKTLGNVVDPLNLVQTYNLDAFRYFFLRHLPAYDNGDYSLKRFVDSYNNELVDQLANLINRLQHLTWQKCQGKLPFKAKPNFKDLDKQYEQAMNNCHFNQILETLFKEIRALNRNLEETQPWSLEDKDQIEKILDENVVKLKFLAHKLEPFIPQTASIITRIFKSSPIEKIDQVPLKKIKIDDFTN